MNTPTDEQICKIINSKKFNGCKDLFEIKLKIRFGYPGKSIKELRNELIDAIILIDKNAFN